MAKVIYPPTVSGIVGRVTTGVYYRARGTRFGYLRSYVMPAVTDHNNLYGSYLTNIRKIWADDVEADYKVDLANYAKLYKDLPFYGDDTKQRTNSTFAIWYKILHAWQASDPDHVDLSSITAADILTIGQDVLTVAAAVNSGAIPKVEGIETLTAPMVVSGP